MKIEERPFTVDEVKTDEAFVTSASSWRNAYISDGLILLMDAG